MGLIPTDAKWAPDWLWALFDKDWWYEAVWLELRQKIRRRA